MRVTSGRCSLRGQAAVHRGPPVTAEPAGFDTPPGCDYLDQAVCLQPWPNDYFTVADSSTPTGRRLDLQR